METFECIYSEAANSDTFLWVSKYKLLKTTEIENLEWQKIIWKLFCPAPDLAWGLLSNYIRE